MWWLTCLSCSLAGVIAAVLGAENASGDFEVVDICFAGMPPQPSSSSSEAINGKAKETEHRTKEDVEREDDSFVAFASGLELGTNEQASDYRVGLLAEWLLGEVGGPKVRHAHPYILQKIADTFCAVGTFKSLQSDSTNTSRQ